MNGICKTLHLFNIYEGAKKSPEENGQLVHHLVMKLLYLCRRTRLDIQTAMDLLCTRVQAPDVDDLAR